MVEIRFRPGAHVGKIDPEQAAEELQRIYREGGDKLDAVDVVEAARDDASPLHDAFEWSDTEAAEQFRLQQARRLIRAVVIVENKVEPARPVWVHVEPHNYQPIETLVNDVQAFELALKATIRQLDAARRSFDDMRHAAVKSGNADLLDEVLDLYQQIGAVSDRLAVLRRGVA
jgi:tRNA A37 N6-isopentenylltransferase MiaA